jgi:Na+/H+ antiporter NhaD/arsenite permease-like protein
MFAILVALLTWPIHEIEPAWFTVMAMMGCAVLFDRHHFGRFLEFVEWDTLFSFALLFVLVESLSELGVIRTLGDALVHVIKLFPESERMYFAIIIILWVSGIGSAFLESLPYTTTIVYIIKDLLNQDIPGVDVATLCWPLSVGACVGGIGSIMGSSANLVCMAISSRYAESEEDKVQGSDFLKYGLPVLLVLLCVSTVWQLFLFIWLDLTP